MSGSDVARTAEAPKVLRKDTDTLELESLHGRIWFGGTVGPMVSRTGDKQMATELNNLGLGRLFLHAEEKELDFQPYEVSKYGVGIIAFDGLEVGDKLRLETVNQELVLKVEHAQAHEIIAGQCRYKLRELGMKFDLERIFMDSGCYEKLAAGMNLSQVRSSRFEVEPPIYVRANTFGAFGRYTFKTADVSRSGLLLAAQQDSQAPFIVNTLLEVTIDEERTWLARPVNCLAKVIRHKDLYGPDKMRIQYFGVQFSEFAGQQAHNTWVRGLEAIERAEASRRISDFPESEELSFVG